MNKFVMHIHHKKCRGCNNEFTYPRLYEQSLKANGSKGVELTPINRTPNKKVAIVHLKETIIPCCHECAPKTDEISEAEASRRWHKAVEAHDAHYATKPKPTSKSETIDDIL